MQVNQSFTDVLGSWAALRPEHVALTFLEDGETRSVQLTYGALDRRAREIAVGIRQTAAVGDRALLLHPPGIEFITAFFGCLYAGVVPVPAYPPRNARHYPRIESIIADAEARCVLTESDFRARLSAWLEQRGGTLPVICTDALTGRAETWEAPADVHFNSLAFLQYTSGSTGDPKGVMVTHANLMANQRMIRKAFGHSEGLIQVSWLPVYHDMGLIGNLMQPLFLGGHCVFMSPVAFLQKPRRWLAAISNYQADGSGAPNFALRLCTRSITAEQKQGLDLSTLKVFFSGSEPINATVLEEFTAAFAETGFRRGAFYCCYGMAETTLLATGSTPGVGPILETLDADALTFNLAQPAAADATNRRVVVGCGKAAEGQELTIVGDDGERLWDGRVGEIWLRGPNIATGYWRKPELTQAAFCAELGGQTGYLRTGDLGFLREGELFVTGRVKDLIIIHGRNHYPQDLENTVDSSHVALALGGCAAITVEAGGEESLVILAEVQRSMLRSLNAVEVFARIRGAIFEQHELPVRAIVLIRPATLPRTSSGKVQRKECRAQFLAQTMETVAAWTHNTGMLGNPPPGEPEAKAPGSNPLPPVFTGSRITSAAIESWVQKWIASRLTVEPSRVSLEMAFADSGLDSVSGVALTTDLTRWLGIEVSPTLVWDFPTVRLASKYLAGQLNVGTKTQSQSEEVEILKESAMTQTDESLDETAELLAQELASLRESTKPAKRKTQLCSSLPEDQRR